LYKQDWARLRKCIAPTLRIDYRSFLNKIWEAMPAEEYVAMVSDPKVLGDPRLMTQHFQGASKWEKVSDDEIIGYHQLRVPHQRYTDETRSAVALKGHAHSSNTRKLSFARPYRSRTINRLLICSLDWYKKIDGEVRFALISYTPRWFVTDYVMF
jgi:scytalone dehydratase